jgi:DNA gyrase subunit B
MANEYTTEKIEILEGLEAIRKRPGLYIGSIDTKGLDRMLDEIIDNSTEEAIAGYCNKIEVILNPDNSFTVTDNGRGIPVDIHPKTQKSALETILTTLCACGRFKSDNEYKICGGLRGIGIAPINALSEWLEVTVWRNNKTYYQRYEKDNAVTTLQEQPNDKNGTGTSLSFKPDSDTRLYFY